MYVTLRYIKPGFHIFVSVVRIVSAPANDPDDYMETQFDAILYSLSIVKSASRSGYYIDHTTYIPPLVR